MFKLFCGLLDQHHVRLFKFDLNGIDIHSSKVKGSFLFTFDLTGVILSNREDAGVADHYVQGSDLIRNLVQEFTDNIHDFITQFSSREGLSTTINSMLPIFALDRLSFVKMLLTGVFKERRAIYFSQNINKEYIEEFNEEVAPSLSDADKELWKAWYEYYFRQSNVHKIDQTAIVLFLSIMLDEEIYVIDDWFRNTDEFNFEQIEIKLQPWFKPEFLVLYKYFPNVQYLN